MALSTELADDLQLLIDQTADWRLEHWWRYYTGDHPKTYVTPKLRETFKALADSFDENYCGLAINSRLSRLRVEGWEGPGADAAQEVWERSKLPRRQVKLWRYALVHGRAVLIADVTEGEDNARLRINPATMAYAHPNPDDPELLLWVGKMWQSTEGWRASIMYPDRTLRLQYPHKDRPTGSRAWTVDDVEGDVPNPLKVTPGVSFNPYDDGQPLVDTILGLQNRINKLAANKFVAAEFGAFRQRVFFTRQAVTPFDLKNAPDEAIILDPGDQDAQARVQELTATELSNYDNAKNAEVDALFTLATLPRHMRVNPGAPPSGEAIKADEGPFVEALKDLQDILGESLAEAMLLLGIEATPVWRDPTVHNELNQAQTVQTFVDAGMPVDPLMVRYAGWSDEEVTDARTTDTDTGTGVGDQVGAALLSAFNAPGVPAAPPEPVV